MYWRCRHVTQLKVLTPGIWRQQRLADAIGVSQSSINKYENHNIEPDIDILKRLADYFNTSIDFIVGYTDERQRIERTESYRLSHAEAELLLRYRSLTDDEKQCIHVVVDTLSKGRRPTK